MGTGPYPAAAPLDAREAFFFDLRGYLVVRGALAASEVAACNRIVDDLQALRHGEWRGRVQGHGYGYQREGLNLQQIYEAGEPFEALLDHPAYVEKARTLVGGEGTFDYNQAPLYIDEAFANLRPAGGSIPAHSGAFADSKRTRFRVANGRFDCAQVVVLIALSDIGEGDGATMVVPGSHKSAFPHPDQPDERTPVDPAEAIEGMVEIRLRSGDALVFSDAIMHGAAKRVNPGHRRIVVQRYGPGWASSRHGYRPSPELLARLTPARRKLVQPLDPLLPPVLAEVG